MAKVSQLYNMTANDGLRLSEAHVKFLGESADLAAQQLFNSSPAFQQALQQKLAGVKRGARAIIEDGDSAGVDDGPLGPPPEI